MFHAQIGGDDESERRLVSLEALEGVRQVWLIADARDVALITAPVPPLSGKRLKQALPNVIEEYVLQDPARCLIVPGPVLPDGQRVIGVIDAHWVDAVLAAFKTAGIRVEALWPGQLVLPWEEGKWTVLVSDDNLTVRTGEWTGTGWAAGESESAHRETASALLSGKLMGPPPPRVNVWLGQQEWRSPMKVAAIPSDTRLDFTSVPPVRNAPLDLLAARNAGLKTMLSRIDWRLWKGVGVLAGRAGRAGRGHQPAVAADAHRGLGPAGRHPCTLPRCLPQCRHGGSGAADAPQHQRPAPQERSPGAG